MSIGIIKKAGVTLHRQITCTACCSALTRLACALHGTARHGMENVHQAMKYKAFNCGYASSE